MPLINVLVRTHMFVGRLTCVVIHLFICLLCFALKNPQRKGSPLGHCTLLCSAFEGYETVPLIGRFALAFRLESFMPPPSPPIVSIGRIGVGWQRHCKTCRSLLELLDNQDILFRFCFC